MKRGDHMLNFPADILSKLDYSCASSADGLTFVPLIGDVRVPAYLLLSEALETGRFSVTEISQAGSVRWLMAQNRLEKKVLIIEGEEVLGGKQNRTINVTILVAEKSSTRIPVSCVERNRWSRRSGYFEDSGRIVDYNVRSYKYKEYAKSREARARYMPDQTEVWYAVDETLDHTGVNSRTSASYDAYRKKKKALPGLKSSIELFPDQTGVAVFLHGRLIGIDYLVPAEKFSGYFEKIISSYLITPRWLVEESMRYGKKLEDVEMLLAEPEEIALGASPGLGKNLFAFWDGFAAHGLVYEGKILHLTVLKTPKNRKNNRRTVYY